MKLRCVRTEGLFKEYDYRIDINDDLTFVHSPNGYGKSTVMSMIHSLLTGDLDYFREIPFDSITLEFNDGTAVTAEYLDDVMVWISRNGVREEATPDILTSLVPCVYLSADRMIIRNDNGTITDSLEYYCNELRSIDKERHKIQMDAFEWVVNKIFVNKNIDVDSSGELTVRMENGTALKVSKLSAGEKQILIMMYVMIFHSGMDSLMMIDEPEISLHISWQQQLGDIFLRISEILNMQLIVTTHSPMVIHDKWDYAQELRHKDA